MKNTRQRIISEFIECVWQIGLEKSNFYNLSDRLSISRQSILYYFPKKDKLLEASHEYITSINYSIVEKHIKPIEQRQHLKKLEAYIKGNLTWSFIHKSHVALLMQCILAANSNKSIKNLISTTLQRGENNVYTLIVTGVAEKSFLVEGNMIQISKLIHNALTASIIKGLYENRTSIKQEFDTLKSLLTQILTPKGKSKNGT